MPITYEKEFKRYISSEAYKNLIRRLKLCWALKRWQIPADGDPWSRLGHNSHSQKRHQETHEEN